MLRPLFRCVLLLHQPYFRKRFADEMLSIFDHAAGAWAEFLLLIDALLSLARQWGLRLEFWDALSSEQQPVPDGVPSFYTLAPFHPRTPAVIHGLVLSIALFCLTCFGIRYSWIRILHVNISAVQFEEPVAPQVNPRRASTTFKISAVSLTSSHEARIALPTPIRTSVYQPIAPVAITTPKRSLGATDSSKSQGPSRFSSPALSTASVTEVDLQAYVGTYVVQSRGRLTILVSAESGYLIVKVAGQHKLALTPVSETKFMVPGTDDWVEFVTDENSTDGSGIRQLQVFEGGQLFIAQRQ